MIRIFQEERTKNVQYFEQLKLEIENALKIAKIAEELFLRCLKNIVLRFFQTLF